MAAGSNSLPRNYDVIIIGGGFAGAALTYSLSALGNDVMLLEAGELLSGSSGACAGRVQLIESHPGSYLQLVWEGFQTLQQLGEELDTDLEWVEPGHLTLISSEDEWQAEQESILQLKRLGIPACMLDKKTLGEIEPQLNTRTLIGASLSPEGHINPFLFGNAYLDKAVELGATILNRTRVIGFDVQGTKIRKVKTTSGEYSAAVIVTACGAWTPEVLKLAGPEIPIDHTHAEALITEALPPLLHHLISLSGFYDAVHGSQKSVALGVGQHPNGTLLISNAIQESRIPNKDSTDWGMPALARAFLDYFPGLHSIRIMRSWAAPSPYSKDQYRIVGWSPTFKNLYISAGFFLAIPTIPILSEKAAGEIHRSQADPDLESFRSIPASTGKYS